MGHLGTRVASERLGLVHVQVLHQMRNRDPAFPKVLYWMAHGQEATAVWHWPDIWHWAKTSPHAAFAGRRLPPLR